MTAHRPCRIACGLLAATLATSPFAAHAEETSQPKIGLIEFAVASAGVTIFQAVTNWASNRIQGTPPSAPPAGAQAFPVVFQPVSWTPPPGQVSAAAAPAPAWNYQTQTPQAVWVPSPPGYQPSAPAGQALPISPFYSTTPVIYGQPDVPFAGGQGGFDAGKPWNWNNQYNYEGFQVAVIIVNAANQPVEVRPLHAGFRPGERFKLRLVTTFDALASIDALRQGGQPSPYAGFGQDAYAGQLYPARGDQVVSLRGGEAVFLPLGAGEYFVFDNRVGVERLVINLRHPRAQGAQVNSQPIYRQDGAQGSSYVQMSVPNTFPAISQVISLRNAI